MINNVLKFEIGFWHPFGPHAGETAEEIIKRKREEIIKNGWTLWSFQFRKTLKLWHQEIKKTNPKNVLVFCSEGTGSKDPKSESKYCNYYIPVNGYEPKEVPKSVRVPHPMGNKNKGSAFIVKNIIYPTDYETTPIEWLKDGQWQNTQLPSRPEYLIKSGSGQPMRKIRAILELEPPYLAEIGVN
jgi:hypothetical protein